MGIDLDLLIAPFGTEQGTPNLPNPTQQKVLDWVDNQRRLQSLNPLEVDHIPVLYLQGGVGSGKSRALLAPAMEMLLEIKNLRLLWARQDLKDLKLSIMDKFFELMPPELIGKRNEQMSWYNIKQAGPPIGLGKYPHSRIYFNGAKDLSGLGSQEFGAILITEVHELTEQAYRALKRRCRQEKVVNMILMEGEAPNEGHWLSQITDPNHKSYDKDVEMWTVSTYENWENLPRAYRGSLESMPEAWKRKYLQGKYGFIPDGKPFYDGFKESMHTGEFTYIKERPLELGWDFGFHHPAVLITQIDDQDRWLWLREIIGRDITIDKFADKVIADMNLLYPDAPLVHYGDPACVQKNDKSEFTSWQILNSKGISIRHKVSEYRLRKEIMEKKLATLIAEKPSIMLDSRYCRTSIEGFLGGYHYPLEKPGQESRDKNEQPFRDGYYEHIMNAGEYIAVNMFKPFTSNVKRFKHPRGRI